ncbi:hypothetical protein G6F57_003890 [Rhizopus arrhizus]|uniref:WD40 repeat-like protein n=1 Tax=Rhizopus oryzae TaxID=64495 RepID=A0A9P7BUJ4_RHIOR|nr:hypothetical protein G6F30_004161 [Rhizopus arrhizus]KAG1428817.1 hypothetical protein G6F58_000389 [Rhizopus delemar]KAG0983577.1 hypothetical protein G6F29_005423 [Rhizopus arrhizus]KAG0995644.1 hypothetical protein G6F28_004597 [Rhizopus arrhizus]KAG1009769.1 hypothetical protein G6F27_005279 [Rhizopus arrhizus]
MYSKKYPVNQDRTLVEPNTQSDTSNRLSRLNDWRNLDIVSQKLNIDPDRSIRLVGIHNQFHPHNNCVPPHKKPYVKTKTKLNTNKRFHRIILAQTLAVDTTEVYASSGISVSTNDEDSERAKQPIGAVWVSKFSKDGKYMAAGGQNCVITIWKVLRDLDRSDNMNIQDITPHDPSIKVFHDAPVRIYKGHTADILDLSWSKNNFLISGSMDKTVRLWHISQAICLCVFNHVDIVTSVRFHPKDDRYFLSGSMDSRLRIWSITEKKVAFWNEVPEDNMITAVGFTMDGKTACAGADTGNVFFFETQDLRFHTHIVVKDRRRKHGKKVTGIEPMPNLPPGEDRILVTTNDSKVWMINMKDKSFVYKYKGLENNTMQIRATFSDDGRYIVCGSEDGRLYLWCTDQVTYFPYQSLYDNHLKSVILHNTKDQMMRIIHEKDRDDNDPLGGFSGLIKKGEKRVIDKLRSLDESFHAHEHIVTTTVFAPTRTKQLLAKAGGDIIFDNTPIYVYKETTEKEEDTERDYRQRSIFNRASIDRSHQSKNQQNPEFVLEDALLEEKELFNYPDSQIIVSADLHGSIKVWRMDSGVYDKDDYIQKPHSEANKNVFSNIFTKWKT